MSLLSLLKKPSDSYYGAGAHRYIDRLINSEKNILIVSPYLDDYYAEYLASRSHGKKIHILSSSIRETAAKKLRGRRIGDPLAAAFLAVSVNWLLLVLHAFNPLFAFASVGAGIALVGLSLTQGNNISLKIPKEFVHAKMYVGDHAAIEGSANLTYAGTHKNIEGIRLITDPEKLKELKRRFWNLWNAF